MKIYSRYDSKKVVYESKKETVREAVIEANLRGANLSYADLRYANLSDANLSGANLSDANLSDADLTRITLCNTNFEKTKISYKGKTVEVNFTEVTE